MFSKRLSVQFIHMQNTAVISLFFDKLETEIITYSLHDPRTRRIEKLDGGIRPAVSYQLMNIMTMAV